ncbi:aspartate dehydrogenase [Fodinisporobacter ferrooxydans]|uniref:L-aspartate dehydrogenase n=1 Tax=Fodinisporobacter ferrooxydans TaxID=2901836 RepID=A0ABY4CMA6_9BACL|nr:aspartate dehydrogenase [Alicyclobacillaceae bacterium MYW30-H2]
MLTVGIIGYGSIGRDVSNYIVTDRAGNVELQAILVRDRKQIASHLPAPLFEDQADRFFARGFDIVVEAAGHNAVKQFAERSLRGGSDFIAVSVGAFADRELYEKTLKIAAETGKRLIIPSASIGGLDRIAAAAVGTIEHVTLTSKKPPRAWYGTIVEQRIDLEQVTEPVCVFEGPARESALLFPESINVSAALSLAGIGFDKTSVRVFIDPTVSKNTHHISASGSFGEIQLELSNIPSANPKTGYITAMSIAKVLKNLSTPLMIGL